MKKTLLAIGVLLTIQVSSGQESIDYDLAKKNLFNRPESLKGMPHWNEQGMIEFSVDSQSYVFNPKTKKTSLLNEESKSANRASAQVSPNGKWKAIIKDYNLWIEDIETNNQKQLTFDGEKDYGYATDNAGWKHSNKAIVSWSPDSKTIATFKQDQRHVSDMYLVKTTVGAPELMAWKYPLPEDEDIIKIERVFIDIEKAKVIPFQMSADDRRSTLGDDISSWGGSLLDAYWSADSNALAFVSSSRDHKTADLKIAQVADGKVREIFSEKVETQFESGMDDISWRYLSESNEIIWFSERTNYGHLYLYDAKTGTEKNSITSGNFVVRSIEHIDEDKRLIYFTGSHKNEQVNPYYHFLYRVGFNGKGLKLLTPAIGDHNISFSSDHKFFIDTYSSPEKAPVSSVFSNSGKTISILKEVQIDESWSIPQEFTVKSANGKWDLYGLIFKPVDFDPSKKYPVVLNIYPGPQVGSIGSWGFRPGGRNAALASLGFIVVQINGSCTPYRSKAFHDACYGNMGENTLPDQISGLKELAERLGYLDLNKVGIYGHSGGGFATAAALFNYPEFFKVGVSSSGNHDNRNYEDDWGERYNGLISESDYEAQANQIHADNLQGKLMLMHGGMDDNVPPYNTYLVVDALIKANKDFDLVIYPNARHGYGGDSLYQIRRTWDYFVKHLMGINPPKEYKLSW